MGDIEEIFVEYTRMRQNGLEAKETLSALRAYIEPLGKSAKEELAARLRAWEAGDRSTAPATSQSPSSPSQERRSVIQPIKGKSPFAQTKAGAQEDATWATCPNCGKKNRRVDVFCYACGNILEPEGGKFDTQHFSNATNDLYRDDYFGPDSVMIVELRDSEQYFELRPQNRDHEVVVGRSTGNSAMIPDIDLAEHQGDKLGVSRLHLAIKHDAEHDAVQIYDLGSSNGTYINGQKLHPKELRVLRHNDELRLGRLVMRVFFNHPGEEITP